MKRVHVQYFALLREQRGIAEETCETAAETPVDLYVELSARHRFTLPPERVRAAINDEFAPPSVKLQEGDRVAFLPPVAGG
jgi:molybdopterin converting factor subunit 1